jgi:CheY-like chemotaxis protein
MRALLAVPSHRARTLYETLRRAGFAVTASCSGGDALRALSELPDVGLLVAHTRLPTLGGLDLSRHFLQRTPAGRVVLLCETVAELPDEFVPGVRALVEPVMGAELVEATGGTGWSPTP